MRSVLLALLLALLALALLSAAGLLLAVGLAAAVTHKPVAATAFLLCGLALVLADWRLSRTSKVHAVLEWVAKAYAAQYPMLPWTRTAPKSHLVAVHDTRPAPSDPAAFDPYYVAICNCGWAGPPRQSSEEAFHDAYTHDTHVQDKIQRPIG